MKIVKIVTILILIALSVTACKKKGNSITQPPVGGGSTTGVPEGEGKWEIDIGSGGYNPLDPNTPIPSGLIITLRAIPEIDTTAGKYNRFGSFENLPAGATEGTSTTLSGGVTVDVGTITYTSPLDISALKAVYVKQYEIDVTVNNAVDNFNVTADKAYSLDPGKIPTDTAVLSGGDKVYIDAGTKLTLKAESKLPGGAIAAHRVKEFVMGANIQAPATWAGTTATRDYIPNKNDVVSVNGVDQYAITINDTDVAKRKIYLTGKYSSQPGEMPKDSIVNGANEVNSEGTVAKTVYFDNGDFTLGHDGTILHTLAGVTTGHQTVTAATILAATFTVDTTAVEGANGAGANLPLLTTGQIFVWGSDETSISAGSHTYTSASTEVTVTAVPGSLPTVAFASPSVTTTLADYYVSSTFTTIVYKVDNQPNLFFDIKIRISSKEIEGMSLRKTNGGGETMYFKKP